MASGPHAERDRPSWSRLSGKPLILLVHHGKHGVAAGHWMVGEEQEGAAVRRYLNCTSHQTLGGQLVVPTARQSRSVQTQGNPVALHQNGVRAGAQQVDRVVREPIQPRSWLYVEREIGRHRMDDGRINSTVRHVAQGEDRAAPERRRSDNGKELGSAGGEVRGTLETN